MRFLADENFPRAAIFALRADGHDVFSVRESAPGLGDRAVLERAVAEQRVLVTLDKDFGEIAFRAKLPAGCGVVLFRLPAPRGREAGERIAALLSRRSDWAGHFAVIEPGGMRMRTLPNV